jgi:L-methionine (R)-S-oxide reductase
LQVHADASNFASNVTKEEAYKQVLDAAEVLFEGQRNWVSSLTYPAPVNRANKFLGLVRSLQFILSIHHVRSLSSILISSSNLANTASLIWHAYQSLPSPSSEVNWAGFYVLNPLSLQTKPELILGPFQGKVACQTIAFGRGVCGTAASTKQTQLVPDVEEFPGHIACDGDSASEIVVPIVADGKIVAVIDVDCKVTNGFDEVDKVWLERLAELLGGACDW